MARVHTFFTHNLSLYLLGEKKMKGSKVSHSSCRITQQTSFSFCLSDADSFLSLVFQHLPKTGTGCCMLQPRNCRNKAGWYKEAKNTQGSKSFPQLILQKGHIRSKLGACRVFLWLASPTTATTVAISVCLTVWLKQGVFASHAAPLGTCLLSPVSTC